MYVNKSFLSEFGESGTLYIKESKSLIKGQVLFEDNKHISAFIRMKQKVFNENVQAAFKILVNIFSGITFGNIIGSLILRCILVKGLFGINSS